MTFWVQKFQTYTEVYIDGEFVSAVVDANSLVDITEGLVVDKRIRSVYNRNPFGPVGEDGVIPRHSEEVGHDLDNHAVVVASDLEAISRAEIVIILKFPTKQVKNKYNIFQPVTVGYLIEPLRSIFRKQPVRIDSIL